MERANDKSLSSLGFLTVVDCPNQGIFGGYLVLNTMGRPLEFHCTTPLRPNRVQKILFGPTLQPYLYGEQIGQTLFRKARRKPAVLLTDTPPVLFLSDFVTTTVVLVGSTGGEQMWGRQSEGDVKSIKQTSDHQTVSSGGSLTASRDKLTRFSVRSHQLAVSQKQRNHCGKLTTQLHGVADHVDLCEPFDRIQEAIREAQQVTTDGRKTRNRDHEFPGESTSHVVAM